jgi:hypothetical protein
MEEACRQSPQVQSLKNKRRYADLWKLNQIYNICSVYSFFFSSTLCSLQLPSVLLFVEALPLTMKNITLSLSHHTLLKITYKVPLW